MKGTTLLRRTLFFLIASCASATHADFTTLTMAQSSAIAQQQGSAAVNAASVPPPDKPFPPPSLELTPLDVGVVEMDGSRTATTAFGAGMIAMATLRVPVDAKPGQNAITVFEFGDTATFRRAWLSRTAWDTSATEFPHYVSAQSPVFQFSIGAEVPMTVNMRPGDTWYLMVSNQKPFPPYDPSIPPGRRANIGIKWYPPL